MTGVNDPRAWAVSAEEDFVLARTALQRKNPLVSGACFAEFGIDVTCVDVDVTKIEKLNSGIIPIYEPGLDQIVEKNVNAGRLHFTTDIKAAVEQALVVFLAVQVCSIKIIISIHNNINQ